MTARDRRVDALLASPPAHLRLVLLHGPDHGLVRERADRLRAAIVPDADDPFRLAALDASAVIDDPALLLDEALAMSMTGGRRVVRISEAGDRLAPAVRNLIEAGGGDALVILEAGDLSKRSSLRTAVEKVPFAESIPCYPDKAPDLGGMVVATLREHGHAIEPDALSWIVGHLGADRLVSRGEVEKLALYMASVPGAPVTRADAMEAMGDASATGVDSVLRAALGGDPAGLDATLARLFSAGQSPIMLLRAVSNQIGRLHQVRGAMAAGLPLDGAMARLRPPVPFPFRDAFRAQLDRWSEARLAEASMALLEAEEACKRTGAPDRMLAERALMRLAMASRRRN